jgi:hypothetical protein
MSARARLLAAALATVVVVVIGLVALDRWSGFPTRAVPLPTPLPSGFGIPGGEIVLRTDGVGELNFGASGDEVLAAMRELIGEPGEDTVQPCGNDGAQEVRWLGWGNLSLLVEEDRFVGFVTGIYFPPIGPELDLRTDEGLRLRMTEDELVEIYGHRVRIEVEQASDDGEVSVFGIDGYWPRDYGAPSGIGGFLERVDERTQVIALNGGLLAC